MLLSLVDGIDGATRLLVRERATGTLVIDCLVTAPYVGTVAALLQAVTPVAGASPPAPGPVAHRGVLALVADRR